MYSAKATPYVTERREKAQTRKGHIKCKTSWSCFTSNTVALSKHISPIPTIQTRSFKLQGTKSPFGPGPKPSSHYCRTEGERCCEMWPASLPTLSHVAPFLPRICSRYWMDCPVSFRRWGRSNPSVFSSIVFSSRCSSLLPPCFC